MGHRNSSRDKRRRRTLHRWAISVERDPQVLGGSPVFAGTRTSVEHVGCLLLKGSIGEVREDFSHLSARDLENARRWALRTQPERLRRMVRLLETHYRQGPSAIAKEVNLPLRLFNASAPRANGIQPLKPRKFHR